MRTCRACPPLQDVVSSATVCYMPPQEACTFPPIAIDWPHPGVAQIWQFLKLAVHSMITRAFALGLVVTMMALPVLAQESPIPALFFQIHGGDGIPIGKFSNEVGTGIGVGGIVGYRLTRNLAVTLSADYLYFSGETKVYANGFSNYRAPVAYNVVPVAIGGRYSFLPGNRVSPFAGASVGAFMFKVKFGLGSNFITHAGIIPSAGVQVRLSEKVRVDVSAKYPIVVNGLETVENGGFARTSLTWLGLDAGLEFGF